MIEHKIDLTGKPLGRAASEVAKLIIGKDSSDYAPNKLSDNKVTVMNVDKIIFSGRKLIQKKYYKHSGYIGSLKVKPLEEQFRTDAKKLFTGTVKGMLPKNKLASQMIKKLKYE
jgi:large subunit ribosomal protein L13